jgi:hypothetical protein
MRTCPAPPRPGGGAVTSPAARPDPAWTLRQACDYFADGGLPVEEKALAEIIAALRRQSGGRHWNPVGRAPSPEQGGIGKALYPVAELMRLHAQLAPWLVPPFSGT